MRVANILDLVLLAMVAVVVLLPRPDVTVKPALRVDADSRLRLAELEEVVSGRPGDLDAALELADLFLDGRRPDWALLAVAPALAAHPADHRLYVRRSLALADHFEAPAAFAAADHAVALCERGSSAPCGDADHARISLLRDALARVKDLDMRAQPNAAKERLLQGLRPGQFRRPRGAR